MDYNDTFSSPPQEPEIIDGEPFYLVHLEHAPLAYRRKEFGMTQQQVADASGITLRQYQKLESGERNMSSTSMRIGLSICRVLKLDPYRFVYLPASE